MKKIFAIASILSLGALSMVSCSDFLDQTSPSEQNTENVYNSTYYTSLVINKIYGNLGRDYTYSQCVPIIWGANSDTELIDGLGTGVETASERGFMNYRTNASGWSKLAGWWTDAYAVIEYCNLAEEGINASDLYKNGSKSEKTEMERYLGEAITIRAMMYQDIIRMWGDVPMKFASTQADLSNAYQSKTDRDEILDSLMTQLEKAIDLLPWADEVSGYTTEHVTKGFAKALYAQIALTRAGYAIRESSKTGYETASFSDPNYPTQRPDQATRNELYKKAAHQLADIINDGTHELNPSYENEWYLLNQLTLDKTYRENIFEIPMLENVTGELGYTVGKRMNGVTSDFGYGNSSGKLKTTATLLYSYDHKDTRRDVTCAYTQFKEDGKVTIENFVGNAPFGIYIGKWRPEWMSESWLNDNLAASAKHLTGINVVRMRYSQVLLYYAECLNELIGPDASLDDRAKMTARQALELVHSRAFADEDKDAAKKYVQSITKDSFFDALVQENAWELTGEGVRKFDLIRWGILAQKIADMKSEYAQQCLTWPTKIYFKYTDSSNTRINMSSVCLYGTPDDLTGYADPATGFGFYDDTKDDPVANAIEKRDANTQYTTNLPRISEGLVGTTIDGTIGTPVVINGEQTIKNRYIMPIYTTTLSDSEGALKNSYGF